jgi:DNA-directed RNA polymerase specialized sigma24 family protein
LSAVPHAEPEPPPVTDAELARRIAARPAGAAAAEEAELYRRLAPRVRLYGLRHLRSEAAAADLAQHVLVLAIEKLRTGQVREPDRIASFVLSTARPARDLRRATARHREDSTLLRSHRDDAAPMRRRNRSTPTGSAFALTRCGAGPHRDRPEFYDERTWVRCRAARIERRQCPGHPARSWRSLTAV